MVNLGKKKILKGGWYHFSEHGHTSDIKFYDCSPSEVPFIDLNVYGPFRTFGEAKKDAIQYHQTDVTTARLAIQNIKQMRKSK